MKKIVLGLAAMLLIFSLTGCEGLMPPLKPSGKDPVTLTQTLNAGGNIDLENKSFTEDAVISKANITVSNADLGGKTLTVNAAGVTLKNIKNADLIIGEAVGNGDVYVDGCSFANVTVKGGGSNSIHFKTTTVTCVNIVKSSVRVVLEENTTVTSATIAADNAKLEAAPAATSAESAAPTVGNLEVAQNTSGVVIEKVKATSIVLNKNVENVTVSNVETDKIEVKENANTTTITGGTIKTIEIESEVEFIKIEDCTIAEAQISVEAGNVEVAGGTVKKLHLVTEEKAEVKTVITVTKSETVIENAAVIVKNGKVTTETETPVEVVVPKEIADSVELPKTIEVMITAKPDYIGLALTSISMSDYDGAVNWLYEYYKENPTSDEAKLFYALAEIASVSTDKSIAELLQKYAGFESYPAKMNSLITGKDWLVPYPEREKIWIYKLEESENGFLYRCDIDQSKEYYEYKIEYIIDEDGDWIVPNRTEYNDEGYKKTELSITGVATPSETGKYLINYSSVINPTSLGVEGAKVPVPEIPKNTKKYSVYSGKDDKKYVLNGEYSKFPLIKLSEEFMKSDAYKDSLVKGVVTSKTVGMSIGAALMESNVNGLNDIIDDCIKVLDNDHIKAAREAVASMTGNVEIPEDIVNAFDLGDYLGEDGIAIGKSEFNLILSALDTVKGVLMYLSSYDLSIDLTGIKEFDYNNVGVRLPASEFETLINKKTLAPRADAAERMDNAKTTIVNSLKTILDSYEAMLGEDGYYPAFIKQYAAQYVNMIIPKIKDLKDAIEKGDILYCPYVIMDSDGEIRAVNLMITNAINPKTNFGIDMGKLFTPGYFSDFIAKDENGNAKVYVNVEYEFIYSSSEKPEKLNPAPPLTGQEDLKNSYYDYKYRFREKAIPLSQFDEKQKIKEIENLLKESGYKEYWIDIDYGYLAKTSTLLDLLVNYPPENFEIGEYEVLPVDSSDKYSYYN